jgi:hypothetical protein
MLAFSTMNDDCFLDDDGGSVVIAVEETDAEGHRQGLWFRVGPVFRGDHVADDPGVWIEYQEEYMGSPMTGPVLLTPEIWCRLAGAIRRRLGEWEGCDLGEPGELGKSGEDSQRDNG